MHSIFHRRVSLAAILHDIRVLPHCSHAGGFGRGAPALVPLNGKKNVQIPRAPFIYGSGSGLRVDFLWIQG